MSKTTCPPAMHEAQPAPSTGHRYRERLLRIDDVCFLTGLGRSTIYAKVKGGDFPGPVQLHGACVAWRETEVDTWIAARPVVGATPSTPPMQASQRGRAGRLSTAGVI